MRLHSWLMRLPTCSVCGQLPLQDSAAWFLGPCRSANTPEHLHSNADDAPDPLHSKVTDGALTPRMASWRRCSSLRPRVCLTSRSGRSRWSASMMDAVASRMVSVAPTQLVAAAVGQQIGRLLPKQKLSSQHEDGDTVGVRTA
jgi:hypothetical protein